MPSLFVILGIKIKQEQTQRIVKILQKILAKKKAELACLGERHLHENIKRGAGVKLHSPQNLPQRSRDIEACGNHEFAAPKTPFLCSASILEFLLTPYK